jgi:hypothetical protein
MRSYKAYAGILLASMAWGGAARAEQAAAAAPQGGDHPAREVASIEPNGRTDSAPPAIAPAAPPDAASKPAVTVAGFQIESGVATSELFRGRPIYLSRTDPASQTVASITLAGLGPGYLTFLARNATALADFNAQPGTAIDVVLLSAYTLNFAKAFFVSFGYDVALLPTMPSFAPGAHPDFAHELFSSLSYKNPIITPKLAVYGEFVRLLGVYAALSGSHTFALGPVSITPEVSVAFAAYRDGPPTPPQMNDATASLAVQWMFFNPGYLSLRGAYSYLGGPSSSMPMNEVTPLGRSVPWGILAIGAQR